MKSTKNLLRTIFCIALIFAVVLSMASCDIKGAFKSLGDGDFKGAWKSLIGKADENDEHEHNYVVTSTVAPTCTTEGYATYACECGDSYIGDRVAALGHNYKEKVTRFPTPLTNGILSKICMTCGVHTDTSLEAVTFELPSVSAFLRSLVGPNTLEVNAKDSEIIIIKEIFNHPTYEVEYNENYLALNVGYISISGEGDELSGHISFDLGVATYDSEEEDALPTYESQIYVTIFVNGENVSVSVKEDEMLNEDDFRLSELFYSAIANTYGMSYDAFMEVVYVSGKAAALTPILQGAIEGLANIVIPDDASFESLMALIADEFVVVEGNVYKINFSGLADLVSSIQGKTVAEVVDEKYGAGTVARLEDFIVSLPTSKLRDIADSAVKFADKTGASLDDVYALVNYIVFLGSGVDFNIEAEIITRYDMTLVEVILEISDDDSDVTEVTETLTNNLRNAIAAVKDTYVEDILSGMFGNRNVMPDIGEYPDYEPYTSDSFSESLISYLASLDDAIKLEVTVADDGSIENIYVYVEGLFYLSAGYDESGFSASVEYSVYSDEKTRDYAYYIDVNEFDSTFKYMYGENELYYAYMTYNELGELLSCNIRTKTVSTITHITVKDPEDVGGLGDEYFEDEMDGEIIYETVEVIEDALSLVYTNNGDGTHTAKILDGENNEWDIEATVTETELVKILTGSFTTTYYSEYMADTVVNGTFGGTFPIEEGGAASFEMNVHETTYDFTSIFDEESNCETDRIYDYDNPKVYEVFNLVYSFDGNGTYKFDVDSDNVYHDAGVSTKEDSAELHVTLVETETNLYFEFNYKEDGDDLFVSADYTLVEYVTYAEDPVTEYYAVLNTCTITYTDEKEIDFSLKYTMTETDEGAKYSFDISGFRYATYKYEDSYDYPEYPDYPDYPDEPEYPEYDGSEVTITFYHTMNSSLTPVLDEYIQEFNAMYPNITIEYTRLGSYDDLRDQIMMDLVAGSQPNIAYCYPDHVALYNVTGKVVPLDSLINNYAYGLTVEELEDFIDGFYAEGATFDDADTMYTLPMSKSTEVLFYNQTFFDAHGLSVPTTWEEMEEVCRAIKEIDPDAIPLGIDSEANWFITMCAQLGTPYTSATGEHFLFDTPENQAFVRMLREWYDNEWVITQNIYGSYLSGAFTTNNCYMYIGSSAGARHAIPAAGDDGWPAFAVGISPIPQVDPSNPKAICQGPSLCLFESENSQEVAASWLLMKFLTTNTEFQAAFSMASGYMPVIQSALGVPEYKAFLSMASPTNSGVNALVLKVAFEQMDSYFVSPAFNGSSLARDMVGNLVQVCLTNPATDIDAMIDEMFKCAIEECRWYL